MLGEIFSTNHAGLKNAESLLPWNLPTAVVPDSDQCLVKMAQRENEFWRRNMTGGESASRIQGFMRLRRESYMYVIFFCM